MSELRIYPIISACSRGTVAGTAQKGLGGRGERHKISEKCVASDQSGRGLQDFSPASRFFSSTLHKMPNSGRAATPGRSHYEEAGSHLEYVVLAISAIPFLPRDSFCAPLRGCAL